MRVGVKRFWQSLILISFICLTYSCNSNSGKVLSAYNNFRFDNKVISRLPVYDSLVYSINEKISLFQQKIDTASSYQAYRYIPGSFDSDVFNQLPKGAGSKIDYYFNKLGRNFIYRFDVFKDSTIKIYIRYIPFEEDRLDIEENLSYYPSGSVMQQRTFPAKDTLLSKQCQYWMRVNERRLF